jgi:hypothetical protein
VARLAGKRRRGGAAARRRRGMADAAGAAADAAAEAARTISFRALQRCRSTLEDFTATYFPLHGLAAPRDVFRFLDVLVFVEATVYQVRGRDAPRRR